MGGPPEKPFGYQFEKKTNFPMISNPSDPPSHLHVSGLFGDFKHLAVLGAMWHPRDDHLVWLDGSYMVGNWISSPFGTGRTSSKKHREKWHLGNSDQRIFASHDQPGCRLGPPMVSPHPSTHCSPRHFGCASVYSGCGSVSCGCCGYVSCGFRSVERFGWCGTSALGFWFLEVELLGEVVENLICQKNNHHYLVILKKKCWAISYIGGEDRILVLYVPLTRFWLGVVTFLLVGFRAFFYGHHALKHPPMARIY